MKKYIKITKLITEDIAVKYFQSLWGNIYNDLMKNYNDTIIVLDNDNDILYTHSSEEELKEDWYEQVVLEETFEAKEQVACSDISKENAIEDDDIYKYYFTWWRTKDWKYITENEEGNICIWKYIAKIPKVETINIWDKKYNKKEVEKLLKDLTPIK